MMPRHGTKKGASKKGKSCINLKLLIYSRGQRVLFAEAGKDFVDFLFTLMSLPVGTVINLLSSNAMVGSLGKLYQSIDNLDDKLVQPNVDKETLLSPKVPALNGANPIPLLLTNNNIRYEHEGKKSPSFFGRPTSSPSSTGCSLSVPAFGCSSAPCFGSSSSVPAFGCSSAPCFGSSSSVQAFGCSSAPSSMPCFGSSSSVPAFRCSSAPCLGSSSSVFGSSSSVPAFGCSSAPWFGSPSSSPSLFGSSSSSPSFGSPSSSPSSFGSPSSSSSSCGCAEGGLVKGVVNYMVMDDLEVSPMSTISSIAILNKFDVKEVGALQEKMVSIGMNEGLKLLKAALQSKTVLTDVFLGNEATTKI